MKKLVNGVLGFVLCFSLCACSSETGTVSSTASTDEKENQSLEVDEELLTVEYTIPASFYENSETTVDEAAQEMIDTGDYLSVVVNDDGSITATQTKIKHDAALEEYRQQIDETIDNYLNGENKVASFVSIDYSSNMDEFNIYVDPSTYSDWDAFYAIAFEMSGYFYQLMNGVSTEDMDVVVNFINKDTNETMDTESLQEFLSYGEEE